MAPRGMEQDQALRASTGRDRKHHASLQHRALPENGLKLGFRFR